jgi:hypothetical protein
VHIAVAIEGDAVMVIGLGAFINPDPGKPLDAGFVVIDLGLDVGETGSGFLGSE